MNLSISSHTNSYFRVARFLFLLFAIFSPPSPSIATCPISGYSLISRNHRLVSPLAIFIANMTYAGFSIVAPQNGAHINENIHLFPYPVTLHFPPRRLRLEGGSVPLGIFTTFFRWKNESRHNVRNGSINWQQKCSAEMRLWYLCWCTGRLVIMTSWSLKCER